MRIFSFYFDEEVPGTIEVEYHARFQIPSFQILGLPAPEIQEARERIMAAFQAADLEFPKKKVVVNLTPSSIKKSGTGHDLAIAIKIISETKNLDWSGPVLAWGELGLDASIKSVGRIATLIELLIHLPECERPRHLLLSQVDFENYHSLVQWRVFEKLPPPKGVTALCVDELGALPKLLEASPPPTCPTKPRLGDESVPPLLDLSPQTERILKISLVGKHHVLMLGPKGVGKSEALLWFKALHPEARPQQIWERILNLETRNLPLNFSAPVRQVHAQVRPAHLLGSFNQKGYQAGELALAHGGLFVADEFMEWPRDAKECLREPLQNKRIQVSRVRGSVTISCDFQFIATGNLCPCGGLPPAFRVHDSDKRYRCHCRAGELKSYFHKLSGPILDRIDLSFVMSASLKSTSKTSLPSLQKEIKAARGFAQEKFQALPGELTPDWLEEKLPKNSGLEKMLSDLPSLRARHKVLRVARSIQALERSEELKEVHLFEAKSYRLPETI